MKNRKTENEISKGASEILKIINDNEPISLDCAKAFTHSIIRESANLADALPEKILGNFSYYQGQINGLLLASKMLDLLELESTNNVD